MPETFGRDNPDMRPGHSVIADVTRTPNSPSPVRSDRSPVNQGTSTSGAASNNAMAASTASGPGVDGRNYAGRSGGNNGPDDTAIRHQQQQEQNRAAEAAANAAATANLLQKAQDKQNQEVAAAKKLFDSIDTTPEGKAKRSAFLKQYNDQTASMYTNSLAEKMRRERETKLYLEASIQETYAHQFTKQELKELKSAAKKIQKGQMTKEMIFSDEEVEVITAYGAQVPHFLKISHYENQGEEDFKHYISSKIEHHLEQEAKTWFQNSKRAVKVRQRKILSDPTLIALHDRIAELEFDLIEDVKSGTLTIQQAIIIIDSDECVVRLRDILENPRPAYVPKVSERPPSSCSSGHSYGVPSTFSDDSSRSFARDTPAPDRTSNRTISFII